MYFLFITYALHLSITLVCTSDNVTELVLPNSTTRDVASDTPKLTHEKHESLFSCLAYNLDLGEYELFPNGTLYIEAYNMTLNESLYILTNDTVSFCAPSFEDGNVSKEYVNNTTHLTLIGLGISMICLLLHLVVFSLVPDLRNLPGWNLAALCASLFLSYMFLFVISSDQVSEYRDICVAVASLAHFFLMASFLWMSIMSFDVFMSLLRATGSLRINSTQFKSKKFGAYNVCAFGVALLFTILGLLADNLEIVPKPYRPIFEEMCWFSQKTPLLIFFAGPVIALTCLNFMFFGLSTYTIHTNKMKNDKDGSSLRKSYLMYFRLSVIMGVTWIVGVVATIFNSDWLWYIFVFLNTLQGLFIFLAFTCSTKAKTFFRKKFMGARRGSEQTLAPTFQSYCFYANSIEKDLDKIVDSNKEKPVDTIVIHL